MMVKITILGSRRFSPYEVLAKPEPYKPEYTIENHKAFDDESDYQDACKIFYPAIEESDIIIVFSPDGVGTHTYRDILHARKHHKRIVYCYHPILYRVTYRELLGKRI